MGSAVLMSFLTKACPVCFQKHPGMWTPQFLTSPLLFLTVRIYFFSMVNLSLPCCNETLLVLQAWVKEETIACCVIAIFYISFWFFVSWLNYPRYSCLSASAMIYLLFLLCPPISLTEFLITEKNYNYRIHRNLCRAKSELCKGIGLWFARSSSDSEGSHTFWSEISK